MVNICACLCTGYFSLTVIFTNKFTDADLRSSLNSNKLAIVLLSMSKEEVLPC